MIVLRNKCQMISSWRLVVVMTCRLEIYGLGLLGTHAYTNMSKGGLGILEFKNSNIALMTKWIWRLFNEEDTEQCFWLRLIRAKYSGSRNIFASIPQGGSQFWHSIHKIKEHFKLGAMFHLGDGTAVLFWHDWWTGDDPLKDRFPRLFDICAAPNMLVNQGHRGMAELSFRQVFGPEELAK